MEHLFKRTLTGSLAVFLLMPFAFALSFPDVDATSPYIDAVDFLSDMEILQGDENGNFNPDSAITRAEMAAIICRVRNEDVTNLKEEMIFSDVPITHWANQYVSKCAAMEITNGYDNGDFGPGDSVTYEQAVTMIVRAAGWQDAAAERGGYPDGFLSLAEEHGFLEGLSSGVGKPISRADVAQILYNADIYVLVLD